MNDQDCQHPYEDAEGRATACPMCSSSAPMMARCGCGKLVGEIDAVGHSRECPWTDGEAPCIPTIDAVAVDRAVLARAVEALDHADNTRYPSDECDGCAAIEASLAELRLLVKP